MKQTKQTKIAGAREFTIDPERNSTFLLHKADLEALRLQTMLPTVAQRLEKARKDVQNDFSLPSDAIGQFQTPMLSP